MMYQKKEQRVCVKYCASLWKSATDTLTVIQKAFRDQLMSHTEVFKWHAQFKTGRTSVDAEHRETHKLHNSLHKFKSPSVRIDIGPFTTLLRRWELVMGHANGF
jgi:hypothetical protein